MTLHCLITQRVDRMHEYERIIPCLEHEEDVAIDTELLMCYYYTCDRARIKTDIECILHVVKHVGIMYYA